jgi:hypothetical protein
VTALCRDSLTAAVSAVHLLCSVAKLRRSHREVSSIASNQSRGFKRMDETAGRSAGCSMLIAAAGTTAMWALQERHADFSLRVLHAC